ncbi:BLUF domain-containing protein [Pseudomarimonas salicorniae]|uniref:BLUF domain-containing protein n=1 Tax=Pseudomarimonas salicorniae TaxID=2933270 RepID=A0ABT0GCJ7_9GAMM|nr:BLUF domain-containing protein [Lysobacter sp. CAU 1642]MCK7592253.1 BLUF domain-containing protein [Lysobacter sp. CAU 1642]
MSLYRLIYASRASEQMKPDDLGQILEASQRNNQRVHVSGMLLFSSREFLQCLEGGREAVNATYARILGDPRHEAAVILDYREVARRQFGGWAMHQIAHDWLSRQAILDFSERELFSPTRMSGASACAMVEELAARRTQVPAERPGQAAAGSVLGRLRAG